MVSTLGVLENGLIEALSASLPSYHRRYDRGEVGSRCRVLEFFLYRSFVYLSLSVLRMLSKAPHDNPSCFQSGGTVGAFGSTVVARRRVTTARIIPPGVESTRTVAMALRLSLSGNM